MTARERYEALYARYNDGTYCIGRDAYWPIDLAAAHRDMILEIEAERRTRDPASTGLPLWVTPAIPSGGA